MDLTNEQWTVLEPLIGELPKRADGRGRPWRSSREVMNGILWILRTGAQRADLPDQYPPYQTCHRRFQRWVKDGTFERILEALARDLKERGKLVFYATSQVVVRKLTQWHSDLVQSGTIGRWLPEMFRRYGLQDIRVVATVAQNSQPSSYPQTLARRALKAGVLTPEEAQGVIADWQQRAEQQDYLEFGVFFTVAGRTGH